MKSCKSSHFLNGRLFIFSVSTNRFINKYISAPLIQTESSLSLEEHCGQVSWSVRHVHVDIMCVLVPATLDLYVFPEEDINS